MSNVRDRIIQLSGQNDYKNLKLYLTQNDDVLHQIDADSLLANLDPRDYSLGWLYLLHTKLSGSHKLSSDTNKLNFLNQVIVFVEKAVESQIRYDPKKFAAIIRKFSEILIDAKDPLRGIKTIKTAIIKIRLSSESLTPCHSDLAQLCLLAKNYQAARSILDADILEVDPQAQGVSHKDYLTYYYYGGMIYIGLKLYQRALDFLKTALTVPATTLSAIMIEAFKKYLLVSLLVRGELVPLPKYASSPVQRLINLKFLNPYQEFLNSYTTHSTDDLHKCAQTHSEVFHKDKNFGLVKQCIQSLYRRNIQRLTQTYLTLSLSDIAESVKLPSSKHSELAILRMIEDEEIHATINQKDGMVSFNDDPEQYDTNKTLERVDKSVEKSKELARKLQSLDEFMSTNPVYIQRTMSSKNPRFEGQEDFMTDAPGIERGMGLGMKW